MCCSRASLACSDCTRASGGSLKPFVFLFRRGSSSSVQLLDRLRERERRLSPYNVMAGFLGEGLPMLWFLVIGASAMIATVTTMCRLPTGWVRI
jgi:hypothetical protein